MKKILYKDCNNNAHFLKKIFLQIHALMETEINWNISNLDFIPIDNGDFVNGIPNIEMQKLYNFRKRILDEHRITINNVALMDLLENIRTIYDGNFVAVSNSELIKIKIFDGDIIEIQGTIENKLDL